MKHLFGSHVSCQGGLLKAVDRAVEVGCDCFQIFVCQPRQWPVAGGTIPVCDPKKKGATDEQSGGELSIFKAALTRHHFPPPIAHASYLINLASPDNDLWQKSINALEVEWRRSEALELSGLVLHPGAHMSGSIQAGMQRVVEAVKRLLDLIEPTHCRLLLENTAGQGSCLGWQFEQLGSLLATIRGNASSSMVGICLDTCHAFAAGYDFSTPARLKSMWKAFDDAVGFEQLRAVHVNDSMKELGSRLDRHEHIGKGEIGETALGLFIRSKAVDAIPLILETEKGIDESTGEDWDMQNLAVLRRLAKSRKSH